MLSLRGNSWRLGSPRPLRLVPMVGREILVSASLPNDALTASADAAHRFVLLVTDAAPLVISR